MNKKALILHGWYQETTGNWYPWLKRRLERLGYVVYLQDLPTMRSGLPSLRAQLEYLRKNIPIDKHLIVFGHSLGSVLAMRLAERAKLKKLFLVSAWDFDDLTPEHKSFWRTKISHSKIRRNVESIYCLNSDNDPYITAFAAEQMSRRLGGKYLLIKNAGHFTEQDRVTKIPQLLRLIRRV